jgi:ribosomal protein L7/L12
MKSKSIIILCTLAAALLLVSAASALTIEAGSQVTPPGDLIPGQAVSADYTIRYTLSNEDESIKFYTALDDAAWSFSLTGGGTPIADFPARFGHQTTMTGFELYYETSEIMRIEVSLTGNAPDVTATSEQTILQITHLEKDGASVKGEYEVIRLVVKPEDIQTNIEIREEELDDLRVELDEKYEMGVDTMAAEAKWEAAKDAVDRAKTSTYGQANTELTTAATLIDEAQDLLDEAWAQKSIDNAQAQVDLVGEEITYFEVNRSMKNDARVAVIKTQKESALMLLSDAKDYMNEDNYGQARTKADEAEAKASEAYNASLDLRADIGEGGFALDLSGISFYLMIAGVLAVFVVVAVVFYRKFTQWDELG